MCSPPPPVLSVQELLNIIASVLHLGNVQYAEEEGNACITSDIQIKYLARVRLNPAASRTSLTKQENAHQPAGIKCKTSIF